MTEQKRSANPWKVATFALVASMLGVLVSTLVVAKVLDAREARGDEEEVAVEEETVATPTAQPAPPPAEDCTRYLHGTRRDVGHVARDGVLGAAVGAGLGAAGGAIADGGSGAGKGAGIGALVGAAGGTLYGLNQENQRTAGSRDAYHACLARQGR